MKLVHPFKVFTFDLKEKGNFISGVVVCFSRGLHSGVANSNMKQQRNPYSQPTIRESRGLSMTKFIARVIVLLVLFV